MTQAAADINSVIFKNKKNRYTIANSMIYHMRRRQQYCGRCFAYQDDFENVKKEVVDKLKIRITKKDNLKRDIYKLSDVYKEYKRILNIADDITVPYFTFRDILNDYFTIKFEKALSTDGDFTINDVLIGKIRLAIDDSIIDPVKYKLDKIYKRLIPVYSKYTCTAKYKHCYKYFLNRKHLRLFRKNYFKYAPKLRKFIKNDR